jgi:putative ABC transport system permease protein
MGLLLRSALRFYKAHPWQLVLALSGIMLGVAVFVGIRIATVSAERAFTASTSLLGDAATHRLLPVGPTIPDRAYRDLVVGGSGIVAAPIIELEVEVETPNGLTRSLSLLGVDPIQEAELRGARALSRGSGEFALRLLSEPGTVLLSEAMAAELELGADAELTIDGGDSRRSVTVVGTHAGIDQSAATTIITDLSTAQALNGGAAGISRIDVALSEAEAAELAANPPAGTVLVEAGSEYAELKAMSDAFTTNLTALGLLALVVGMFLIYSTISFAIIQRRKAFVGGAGTVLGLVLGDLLASGLLDLVLRTMDDLYFRQTLASAPIPVRIFGEGLALGTAATLCSALPPAIEAASPAELERRSDLERGAHQLARRAALAALPVAVVGGLLLVADSQSLLVGFGGLFCVLAAGALLIPLTTVALMTMLDRLASPLLGLSARWAVRGVKATLSRTGIATAALTVAVATVMSIGLMISTFRVSFIDWLDTTLTADFYLLGAGDNLDAGNRIAALPGVRGIGITARDSLPSEFGVLGIRAAVPGPDGWGLDLVQGTEARLTEALESGGIVISEPFAYRSRLNAGDALTLPTPEGTRTFPIAAVAREYNSAGAAVLFAMSTYSEHWGRPTAFGFGVHLTPDADREAVERRILELFPTLDPRQLRSTASIERISLFIFDRTFEVTAVLRTLAGLVAFLGILSALMALQLERERELAVLRSIGMSRASVAGNVLAQTGLLGLTAGLLSIPLGTLLAWVLVDVINRRSFGWTMQFEISGVPLAQGVALALIAALAAGLYPGLVASRTKLALALREE